MSIRTRQNTRRLHEAIEEQHQKEAAVRPDPVHRAVVFLLSQAALNNPDFAKEAKYHLDLLDEKFSPATAEERKAVDAGSATKSPLPPTIDVPEGANEREETPQQLPVATADQVRMSSRFGSRGGAVRPTRVHRPAEEEAAAPAPASPAVPASTKRLKRGK